MSSYWSKHDRRRFAHKMLRDAILTYGGLSYGCTQEDIYESEDWLFGPSEGEGPGLDLATVCAWANASVHAVRRAARLTREHGDVLDLAERRGSYGRLGNEVEQREDPALYFRQPS